jgi:hypothetical protein
MTYQDVLSTPTYERKFFLSTLINEHKKKNEQAEETKHRGAKGSRSKTITGQTLKSKMKSGEIPS